MTFRSVFLGPPGAGKGTQSAKLLEAEPAVVHISTGDMLRGHKKAGTDLGRQAASFMDSGKLVPDDLIIAMVEDRLESEQSGGDSDSRKNGAEQDGPSWILDGFPRTLPQAQALDARLGQSSDTRDASRGLTHVIFFRVPFDVLVQRLSGRWTCGQCGAIWHEVHKPVRVAGTCDACGGALRQRPDDKPEAVRERLEVYTDQTEPLLEHYREQGILTEIDANRAPEDVFQSLRTALAGRA